MKPEAKPFRYPFENPSMTVGLAAINATEPLFKVEPRHLDAWFKEGAIARYMLMDDIRELWNREGFGVLFEQVFGKVKNCTLIANCRTEVEWSRTEAGETPTYGVFCIDTVEALYQEDCEEYPTTTRSTDKRTSPADFTSFDFPMPEPVLPRYEAQKIYAMIHGMDLPHNPESKPPVERVTAVHSQIIVELLTSHGFTDTDFSGSISAFQRKVARDKLSAKLASITEKLIVALLKKAGKR